MLVEHAEIFWSLFAVDMDRVLAEQPPDTWDSFPLFQILNDYLRTDGTFEIESVIYNVGCMNYILCFRQSEKWPIPPALERHLCPASREICGSNGIVYCSVDPQRFRKGTLGNKRVSAFRIFEIYICHTYVVGIAMDVLQARICSGSWTPCSRL